jgi:hypothetical protein
MSGRLVRAYIIYKLGLDARELLNDPEVAQAFGTRTTSRI